MITSATQRILLVPDFGITEAAEQLLPLKEAIRKHWNFDAKIIDLRQMIIDENPDKKLNETIDLAAHRLTALATDEAIVWDKFISDDYGDPDLSSYLTDPEPEEEIRAGLDNFNFPVNPNPDDKHQKSEALNPDDERQPPEDLTGTDIGERIIRHGRLIIHVTPTARESLNQGVPDAIVVFGKSAMLVGGVKDKRLLFINPEYDKEWPWKKMYYTERKASERFYENFINTTKMPNHPKVLNSGYEAEYRRLQPQRLYLRTDGNDTEEFSERYPRLTMSDPELRDPEKLALEIQKFTLGEMEMPLLDIYELFKIPERESEWKPFKFTFPHPVEVEGQKAVAIILEKFSPYRMPSEVVIVEGFGHNLLLENISNRRELLALHEAVAEAVKTMSRKKRILIVPDPFTPDESPVISQLRDKLQQESYYVAVFDSNSQLKCSRKGLERCCKRKPFDLIVTLETGCLLAARITNTPRIFVNPNWTVCKEMKERGESYSPTIDLTNEAGIWTLVNEIHKILL